MLGLTPLFGTRLGLPVSFIVWLLSAVQLGSFVCQWPIGRLSDRVDRRWVIVGCATAVALLSPLIALAGADQHWLLPLFFLYGAGSLTFYAVAIAHGGDFAEPDQMVGVSSGSLLAWAAGAAIGPTAAAPFIDRLGPPGLFVYTFLIAARARPVRAVADDPALAAAARAPRGLRRCADHPRADGHRSAHAWAARAVSAAA